jgi:hypothetical protein
MMAGTTGRIVISLRFGRTRGARFEGESRPVLVAIAMVLLCILGVAYLGTTSSSCTSDQAVRLSSTLLSETVQ